MNIDLVIEKYYKELTKSGSIPEKALKSMENDRMLGIVSWFEKRLIFFSLVFIGLTITLGVILYLCFGPPGRDDGHYLLKTLLLLGAISLFVSLTMGGDFSLMMGGDFGDNSFLTKYYYNYKINKIMKKRFKVNDLEIIGEVIDYIYNKPLSKSKEIVDNINNSISKTKQNINSLLNLELSLKNQKVDLLIESRINMSEKCRAGLEEQINTLIKQKSEAENAIIPIKELINNIRYMHNSALSISQIQKSLNLLEDNLILIEENKIQILELKNLCDSVFINLGDIEKDVQFNNKAKIEVISLLA